MIQQWILTGSLLISCGVFGAAAAVAAERPVPMASQMSLQGFSGHLNIPSAFVVTEGDLQFQYANQQNPVGGRLPKWQDQYMLNIGFFDFAEVGGRLTWSEPAYSVNDLSGNFKLTTAPFKKYSPYIPAVAFGIQDVGGGAKHFQTKYVVVSEDIWRFRLTAGYGTGPDRMDGIFGGGEFRPFDWLHLLGEYDTRTANVGGRLVSPPLPYFPVQLTFTGMTSIESRPGNFSMGVGINIPLGFRDRKEMRPAETQKLAKPITRPLPAALSVSTAAPPPPLPSPVAAGPATEPTAAAAATPSKPITKEAETAHYQTALQTIRQTLINAGFVNVQTGMQGATILVVEYENSRYNHNELDALGVVAGVVTRELPKEIERVWLVTKRKGLRLQLLDLPATPLWLTMQEGVWHLDQLQVGLRVSNDMGELDGVRFVEGSSNPGWFWPSVMLYPSLSTFVGTDIGPFEYYLSIKAEAQAALWPGALLNMRWELPYYWSEQLKDGHIYAGTRKNNHMDRLMLQQAIKLWPGALVNLGGGKLFDHNYGTLNEFVWQPWSGEHRFRLTQAWSQDQHGRDNRQLWLGSYRYYYAPFDLQLEATGGKFWGQDVGATVELKRFFGDASIGLYYKNTETETNKQRWQAAGIRFSFPLTPRRDIKPIPLQVRGTDEWSYGQETTIVTDSMKGNYLPQYPLAASMVTSGAIGRSYHNRDRLSEAYLRRHLGRLPEAWTRYRDTLERFW